jgi:hypothetical protein
VSVADFAWRLIAFSAECEPDSIAQVFDGLQQAGSDARSQARC